MIFFIFLLCNVIHKIVILLKIYKTLYIKFDVKISYKWCIESCQFVDKMGSRSICHVLFLFTCVFWLDSLLILPPIMRFIVGCRLVRLIYKSFFLAFVLPNIYYWTNTINSISFIWMFIFFNFIINIINLKFLFLLYLSIILF